jgi:hypothetical protein
MDDGFAQGDHRRPEIPHPLVLRFHHFLALRRRRGFMMTGRPIGAGGKYDGEGGDNKKNSRICEWNIHWASPVRFV